MKRAVIILPTFNERENLLTLIPKIFESTQKIPNWQVEILVVDDYSPDKTAEAVSDFKKKYSNLHLILNKKEGLGKAYIKGFSYALEHFKPDLIFEMDADWSHDPNLIPSFLSEIDNGADFVIGSRYIEGGSIPDDWGLHRKIFSFFGNFIIRLGFMQPGLHDWTSGFRAINSQFIKDALFHLKNYNGYVFQVAILDMAKKKGLKITEIPINFINRKLGQSKINSLQFSINTCIYVFKNSSFIKYFLVGMVGASVDFGLSFIMIEKLKMVIWLSTVISSEVALIFNFLLNNFWSFAHKKIDSKFSSYINNFARFNLVGIGSVIIQALSLHVLTTLLPKNFWYVYKALVIVFLIIPYSYFMYNYFIWKEKSIDF